MHEKRGAQMKTLAKIFRVITVPPILALLLVIYLYFGQTAYFTSTYELFLAALCLTILPLLSYPVCYFVPPLRKGGRRVERKAAFVATGAGYVFLLVFMFVFGFSEKLSVICLTYFFSVLFLIIFNKFLKFKASGHACGVVGPIMVFLYAGGTVMLIPSILILAATVWSSLKLGRHTASELCLGGVCAAAALLAALAVTMII